MKNRKIGMIGGGLCLLFALFFGCGERSGQKEYHKAMVSWKEGDLVRAQGQLEKAIRKLSGDQRSEANNQLGLILWGLGKHDQAVEKFSESCRLAAELSGANLNLGIALYYTGQMEQAEFEFTKILNEQPNHPTARAFMGLIHMQENDWKGASREVTAGLRANPNNPTGQNALALAELHLGGGASAALARLKKLTAAYPDYSPALYNIAVIHDQWLQNESVALGGYKRYLGKTDGEEPQAETARQAIARIEKKSTGSSKANTASQAETVARLLIAGSKLHAAKKYSAAISQYEKAIQIDSSQKTAHYNMGLSYYALKNYSKAGQACAAALKIDPRFADARYMLALSYYQQKKWNDAEREAQALKQLDAPRGDSMLNYISSARKR